MCKFKREDEVDNPERSKLFSLFIFCFVLAITIGAYFYFNRNSKVSYFGATTILTDQQLYILTEILQDRTPTLNTKYSDIKSFTADYLSVAKFLKDDFKDVLSVCKKHKGENSCNLYERIKARINEIQ